MIIFCLHKIITGALELKLCFLGGKGGYRKYDNFNLKIFPTNFRVLRLSCVRVPAMLTKLLDLLYY